MTYQQFLVKGQELFGSKSKVIRHLKASYEDFPIEELEKRKATAEVWLKQNQESPKFQEGLRRYEEICDYLTLKTLSS
jgi:hypothetical protein